MQSGISRLIGYLRASVLVMVAMLMALASQSVCRADANVASLQKAVQAGQYAQVIKSVQAALPSSTDAIAAQLYYVEAQAFTGEKMYARAALAYLRLPFTYPDDSMAPAALLAAANLEANELKDPTGGQRLKNLLLGMYPKSAQAATVAKKH
ncbi:MAG: hypothetical protein HKL96_14025 [Phycisphaerales bacterium]|nr:hypothetical protein [Phycisphaerales bacterium]